MAVGWCLERRLRRKKNKKIQRTFRGRPCVMLRRLEQRRGKIQGGGKFGKITPSPSMAVPCRLPLVRSSLLPSPRGPSSSMAVHCCLPIVRSPLIRTSGRQQWTAIDEDGDILSNFHTPCIFAFVGLKSVPYAHGHRRRVRGIFFFCFPS